ncbi:YcbK family protein [Herbaspirillum huttiense]|uniref:YcbK family protein n=1 Tax=Herbaspirillum huttiense TaxID=863372 RepID=UPI0039B121D3
MNRREFITGAGALCIASALPNIAFGAGPNFWERPRELWISSHIKADVHEEIKLTYWANGVYLPGACDQLNWIMRDVNEGVSGAMNKRLFDILYASQGYFRGKGYYRPILLFSGHRTVETNARVNGKENSRHLRSEAVDYGLDGVPAEAMGTLLKTLHAGGVGVYPNKKSVHADIGPVRSWTG